MKRILSFSVHFTFQKRRIHINSKKGRTKSAWMAKKLTNNWSEIKRLSWALNVASNAMRFNVETMTEFKYPHKMKIPHKYCARFGWTFSSFLTVRIRLLRNELYSFSFIIHFSLFNAYQNANINTQNDVAMIFQKWMEKPSNGKNDDNSHSKQCDGRE